LEPKSNDVVADDERARETEREAILKKWEKERSERGRDRDRERKREKEVLLKI